MIKNNMLYSVTIIYIRQSRVSIEKVHRVVKFNQEASLKSSIDMNTELKKNAKKPTLKKISSS